MRVYYRKIFPHDVTHEVSVTLDIVSEFFGGQKTGLFFSGMKSGVSGMVSINDATDPRFGGDFKKIMTSENSLYKENDIIAIYDKGSNCYSLEIIGKEDGRYSTLIDMYKGKERHLITYLDSDATDHSNDSHEASGGRNVLVYGVPGSGKSDYVNKCIDKNTLQRVVFHPDYTYADFVGQIMPRLLNKEEGGKLSYVFVEGPFTRALMEADKEKGKMHYLVIEEINRGNAPAIFGDVFQLLDREPDGSGTYSITNFDIAGKLYGEGNENKEIRMPKNLCIYATMNTSDQNVFTLDTAFQRRWDTKHIKNDVLNSKIAKEKIVGNEIDWGTFADQTNKKILKYSEEISNAEDKRLGAYFVKIDELEPEQFSEKVLKYLWDDAFKMKHDAIFKDDIHSLDVVLEKYQDTTVDRLKAVLREEFYAEMINAMNGEDGEGDNDVEQITERDEGDE